MSTFILIVLAVAGFNLFVAGAFAWPRIRERWLRYQSNRRRAMLKCAPSMLKSTLRDRELLIAHLEDELLHAQAYAVQKDVEIKDLREEVKALIARNNIMANELRSDDAPGTLTEVYRPSNARRFR